MSMSNLLTRILLTVVGLVSATLIGEATLKWVSTENAILIGATTGRIAYIIEEVFYKAIFPKTKTE